MRSQAIVNLIMATVLSSCGSQHLEVDKFQVGYELRYDPQCFVMGQSPPPPTKVMIDPQSTALNVMEATVMDFDPTYRFSATYFGTELGYFIDEIGNMVSDADPSCFWLYYIISTTVAGDEVSYLPNFGVSNFLIPSNGTRIVWKYELITDQGNYTSHVNSTASNSTFPDVDPPQFVNDTDHGPGTFLINYIVTANIAECPVNQAAFPPPVTVSIPRGGSALNVVENARDISKDFSFRVTYFGVTFGYLIHKIGETSNNDICFWKFLYQTPTGERYAPNVGVSNFVLPVNGGTVIMDFTVIEKGPPPPTAPMATDGQAVGEQEDTVTTDGTGYMQPNMLSLAVVISTMILMLFY